MKAEKRNGNSHFIVPCIVFEAIARYDFKNKLATHYLSPLLFTTTKGYLGLWPGTIEKGDRMILFAGARTPLIIRPVDTDKDYFTSLARYISMVLCKEKQGLGVRISYEPISLVWFDSISNRNRRLFLINVLFLLQYLRILCLFYLHFPILN